jgi:hypothetical protein
VADDRLTIYDFNRSKNPDGTQAKIVEVLAQENPAIQDAPAYPSNADIGHRVTIQRNLPAVGTAKINKGITRSKGTTEQIVDAIGYWAARSEVDPRIRKVYGEAAYMSRRMGENRMFAEAFSQATCNALFYGNHATDESSFDGFSPRMGSLNTASFIDPFVLNMAYSVSVSGGDGCSIYVIDWGPDACHLIYPKEYSGSMGLVIEDLPDRDGTDVDGTSMRVDVTEFHWFLGLACENRRHMGRLANIDLSDALLASPTQGFLLDELEKVLSYMPDPGGATRVMYGPTFLEPGWRKQARSRANQALTIQDYLGKQIVHLWGIPYRSVRQLSTAESTVS